MRPRRAWRQLAPFSLQHDADQDSCCVSSLGLIVGTDAVCGRHCNRRRPPCAAATTSSQFISTHMWVGVPTRGANATIIMIMLMGWPAVGPVQML